MALRKSRSQRDGEGGRTKGFADRIATATKPEPSGSAESKPSPALAEGMHAVYADVRLTRYQRNTANLPAGAKPLTAEEVTNIVVDLRGDGDESDEN